MNETLFIITVILGSIIGCSIFIVGLAQLLLYIYFNKKALSELCEDKNMVMKNQIIQYKCVGTYKGHPLVIRCLASDRMEIEASNLSFSSLANKRIYLIRSWKYEEKIKCDIGIGLLKSIKSDYIRKENFRDFHELLNILPATFFFKLFSCSPKVRQNGALHIIITKNLAQIMLFYPMKGIDREHISTALELIDTLLS